MSGSEFSELIPQPGEHGRAQALRRLEAEMAREQSHRSRVRFLGRASVLGVTLFATLAIVPATSNPDLQPLLGLADAVEEMPAPAATGTTAWYLREEVSEYQQVPPDLVARFGTRNYGFVLPALRERWIEVGGTPTERITYGNPRFPEGTDPSIFYAARLMDVYPVGQVIVRPLQSEQPDRLDLPWDADTAEIYSSLARRVADINDPRPDQIRMLQMAADLLRSHSLDPARRSAIIRAMAQIPGITVQALDSEINVQATYVAGQTPFLLHLQLDADTAELLGESVETVATDTAPSRVIFESRVLSGD